MNDDTRKLLDKVRKLLALAGSTTSVEEARTATSQAERIIAEHRLDLARVEASSAEPEAPGLADDPLWVGPRDVLWRSSLAAGLARHYGCYVWVHRDYVVTDSETGASRGESRYLIVGRPSDVEVCRFMFGWLSAELVRLSQAEKGAAARSAFCLGAVAGVLRTLRDAARAEARRREGGGASLALASRAEEAERWAKTAWEQPIGDRRGTRARGDEAARTRGFRVGKQIHVGASLSSGARTLPGKR